MESLPQPTAPDGVPPELAALRRTIDRQLHERASADDAAAVALTAALATNQARALDGVAALPAGARAALVRSARSSLPLDRAALERCETADAEAAVRALDALTLALAWRESWWAALAGAGNADDPAAAAARLASSYGDLPEGFAADFAARRTAATLVQPLPAAARDAWRVRRALQGLSAAEGLAQRRTALASAAAAHLVSAPPETLPALAKALAADHHEALAATPAGRARQRLAAQRAEDAAVLESALRTTARRADLAVEARQAVVAATAAVGRTNGSLRDEAAEEALAAARVARFGGAWSARLEALGAWGSALLFAALLANALAVRWAGGVPAWLSLVEALAGFAMLADTAADLACGGAGWRILWRRVSLDLLVALPWSLLAPGLASARAFWPAAMRLARLALCGVRTAERFSFRHRRGLDRGVSFGAADQAADEARLARQGLDALVDETAERRAAALTRLTSGQRDRRRAAALGHARAALPTARGWTTPAAALVDDLVDRLIATTPADVAPHLAGWRRGPALALGWCSRRPLFAGLPGAGEIAVAAPFGAPAIAAAACREAGRALHHAVDSAHAVADLVGSAPAPAVADRVGAAIVGTTAGPARRLAYLFGLTFIVHLVTVFVPLPEFIDGPLERVLKQLSTFVLALGVLCAAPLAFGLWLRRRARQTAEHFERVVQAQYAAQTKATKLARRAQDSAALAARVAGPELALRIGDDLHRGSAQPRPRTLDPAALGDLRTARPDELGFIRAVDLLYADYLDGSPFHRTDTKLADQLRGNLAFQNFAAQAGDANEARRTAATLARFSGPQWWFALVNRALTQETAKLLLDYNRNALPWERLASAPTEARAAHRHWLAKRRGTTPNHVELPHAAGPPRAPPRGPHGRQIERFETVEFAATDFLLDDPERDAELRARFGPELAALVARDRREVVRRVFRTSGAASGGPRVANAHGWRRRHWAHGRALLLPMRGVLAAGRLAGRAFRATRRLVREILAAEVAAPAGADANAYAQAIRKIHRMRKPVFMHALWLRARHDPEYLGLGNDAAELHADLDFIGASRLDRVRLAALRRRREERWRRTQPWLAAHDCTGPALAALLQREYPHLAERKAEVERALRMALTADADGAFALGAALEGLRAYRLAADRAAPAIPATPDALPPPAREWPQWAGPRRWLQRWAWRRRFFALPEFRGLDFFAQERLAAALVRDWPRVRGWVRVLTDPGWPDPAAEFAARLHAIILRTELWSDQLVALRTVQTLTGLEIQHYCELVRELGAYAELGPAEPPPAFGMPPPAGPA